MIYLRTWILFVRSILYYSLSFKGTSQKKYYLAGKCLMSLSFRYSDKNKKSFIFFLSSFVKSLLSNRISWNGPFKSYSPGNIFFYENDSSPSNEKNRLSHIQFFLKKPANGSIWKDKLFGYFNLYDKVCQVLYETLLFIVLLPICPFITYKGSVGLVFKEYIELVNLLKLLKRNNISELYYYSIYEKDSNISSIAIQDEGIKVMKITSLTPLKFWNSIIVACDKLILCDINQLEEIETFKETIFTREIEIWGPENAGEVAEHYKQANLYNLNRNVIGFYSSAAYIRELEGHIEQKNMKKNEDTTATYLAEYLKTHPHIKLIIFPHPKEKKEKYRNLMITHYESIFNGLNYAIFDSPLTSAYCFEQADIGVAAYSSVIYERLYYGFKSLLMSFGKDGFEVPGKSLSYICAIDKTDFFSKINTFMTQNVVDYFNVAQLKKSKFMEELLIQQQ